MCCHFFSAVFYPILFILAGNDIEKPRSSMVYIDFLDRLKTASIKGYEE